MDMNGVLVVGSLVTFMASAMRARRNPSVRPANTGVMWLAAGIFATSLADLLGVRDGVLLYLLGVGGLVAIVLGVYKINEHRRARSERESQQR